MYNGVEMSRLFLFFRHIRRRILVSTLILVAAFAISVYVVSSNTAENPRLATAPAEETFTSSQNLNFVRIAPPNLTEQFTNEAVEQLVTQNETLQARGITEPESLLFLPGETDVARIISDIIDSELATEEVRISDLLVNKSDSKATQLAYILFINRLLEARAESFSEPSLLSLPDYFERTALELERIAEMLQVVNAPPSWLEIHRDLVTFFLRQRNIYRSLGAADGDPLRFLIAATRLLPEESGKEFDVIREKIDQKIIDEELI